MAEPLSPEWVDDLVKASSDRRGVGAAWVVAMTVGKDRIAAFEVDGGRVVAAAQPDAAAVTIPLTDDQLAGVLAGSESLAQAFMRGDVKPEGSTGALLAAVELFEDATFRQRLAELA